MPHKAMLLCTSLCTSATLNPLPIYAEKLTYKMKTHVEIWKKKICRLIARSRTANSKSTHIKKREMQ